MRSPMAVGAQRDHVFESGPPFAFRNWIEMVDTINPDDVLFNEINQPGYVNEIKFGEIGKVLGYQ